MTTKMADKAFRDAVVASSVRRGIAYQLRAMRKALRLNQTEAGNLTGKPQTVISRLEDPTYRNVNIKTLLEIASAFDVGLSVRFVSHGQVIDQMRDLSDEALVPLNYDQEIAVNTSLGTPRS